MEQEQKRDQTKTAIIFNRVTQTGPGQYQGRSQLVDAETGEILIEKKQVYSKCHIVYAGYKSLQLVFRDASGLQYRRLRVDTNVKPLAKELAGFNNVNTTLKCQMLENMEMYGIKEIKTI